MDDRDYPAFRSHFVPRTGSGRLALAVFIVLFALTEPPLLYIANRIEPFVLGFPFFYTYLLALYIALIVVLLWVHRRGI